MERSSTAEAERPGPEWRRNRRLDNDSENKKSPLRRMRTILGGAVNHKDQGGGEQHTQSDRESN